MLTIKSIEESDYKAIDDLNNKQTDFKLDNINNCIVDKIVYDGRVAIAYGIVKRMAEAIMLVNHNSPRLLRAKAMRELMIYAESATKAEGLDQLHVFVHDVQLARSLERQFGFVQAADVVLVKNL